MTITKIGNNFIQKASPSFKAKKVDDTMKGVLLNRYIQKRCLDDDCDFDIVSDSFLIPEEVPMNNQKPDEKSGFDYKKTIKPLLFATGATLAAAVGISAVISGYSKKCANNSAIVCPPDLATNVNIMEEPQFALYRALIKPTGRNIFGFVGVCLMSGVTVAAKSFVDGAKDVWVKKQKCDIEHDFQKDMIDVEKNVFVGKLNVVNKMLKNTSDYFKSEFSSKKENAFKGFINFKAKEETTKTSQQNDKKEKAKNILLLSAGVAAFFGIGALVFKNYKNSAKNLETYLKKCEDTEIRANIQKAINKPDKNASICELSNVMKTIRATQETIEENFSKIQGITPEEINKAKKDILSTQIYAQAPEALGGVSNKIQYYCYINEERGHLYNWILHPDNPFNKYLFIGFSLVSATGYIANKVADAIKEVTVEKENKKSELNLKKNLVQVEVENFKAKKEAAINPLIDAFKVQKQNGKSQEELKEAAQEILIEIKKGPPYVYS